MSFIAPNPEASIEQTVDRLAELLQSDVLPTRARPSAEKLVERLTKPVRVAISGDQGVGKSALFHLLQSIQRETGFAPNITFLDTETETHPEGWLRVAQHADMLIWVVADYTEWALDSWQQLPAEMLHHAFLVINTQDGTATPNHATLSALHRQGFASAFSLNIREELSRMGQHAPDDTQALIGTDLDRLLSELHAYVDAGCQADIDGALLFLQRFSHKRHMPTAKKRAGSFTNDAAKPSPPASSNTSPAEPEAADLATNQSGQGQSQVLTVLQSRLASLQDIDLQSDRGGTLVIQHHIDTLDELLSEAAVPDHLDDCLQQAHDLVTLLQLENTDTSAVDATLAMLQLKRHLAWYEAL